MANLSNINVKIGLEIDKFEAGIKELQQGVGRLGDIATNAGSALTKAITVPIGLVGAASLKAAGDIQALKKGLVAVTGSADKAEKEFKALKEVAKLPGLGLKEAVQGSVRLQAVGISAEQARRSLGAFGNAIATVGGGKAELDGVATAIAQIAAKGKVSAEEINQIAERVPQIRDAMLKAFGTADTEKIQKLGLTTTQFIQGVTQELEKLPKVTGGINNAFENMGDAVLQAGAVVGESINKNFDIEGKMNAAADSVLGLAESFSKLSPETQATITVVAGLAAATGPVLFGIGAITKAIPTLVTGLNTLRTTLFTTRAAALGVVGALAALAVAQAVEYFGSDPKQDALLAEQKRFTAEYVSLSDERKKAIESELRAAAQNQARIIAQSERAIQAFKDLNDQIYKKDPGTTKLGRLGLSSESAAAIEENKKKIEQYEQKLNEAKDTLDVFRVRLKAVDETNGQVAKSTEQLAITVNENAEKMKKAWEEVQHDLQVVKERSDALGDAYDYVGERAQALEAGINKLTDAGFKGQSKQVQQLVGELQTLGQTKLDTLKNLGIKETGTDVLGNLNSFNALDTSTQTPDGAPGGLFANMPAQLQATLERIKPILANMQAETRKVGMAAVEVGSLISSSIASGAELAGQALADAFTGDAGAQSFFQGLIGIVADFLSALGKSLIAASVAALAFENLLIAPGAGIAAGIAAVAAAGIVKNLLKKGPSGSSVPALATGTNFFPSDSLAYLHKGEAVVPRKYNPAAGGAGYGGQVVVLDARLRGPDLVLSQKKTDYRTRRTT